MEVHWTDQNGVASWVTSVRMVLGQRLEAGQRAVTRSNPNNGERAPAPNLGFEIEIRTDAEVWS